MHASEYITFVCMRAYVYVCRHMCSYVVCLCNKFAVYRKFLYKSYVLHISTTDMHVCTCVHISGGFRGGAKGAVDPPPEVSGSTKE